MMPKTPRIIMITTTMMNATTILINQARNALIHPTLYTSLIRNQKQSNPRSSPIKRNGMNAKANKMILPTKTVSIALP